MAVMNNKQEIRVVNHNKEDIEQSKRKCDLFILRPFMLNLLNSEIFNDPRREETITSIIIFVFLARKIGGGGGGQGGSLITIHKEKKHLFTFHVENKLNSHFTWN